MQGRWNIEALLKAQPLFADTLHYSVVGYGSPEMRRDAHWIMPVHGGGRLDIYAKTAPVPAEVSLAKSAVLAAKGAGGSTWQFSLTKDDVPGFYEVSHVLRSTDAADSAGFIPTFDQRGFDLSGADILPDVINTEEAAYSRYQTAVIRFKDTATDVTSMEIGDQANYVAVVKAMPLISELQDFCLDYRYRNMAADTLVKAAIPCFLSITCTIEIGAGTVAPDVATIKNAIAAAVNALDFPGQLHASLIAEVIHGYLKDRQAVGKIEMQGRIRQPDGRTVYVQNTAILELPDTPSAMVTGRTTALLCAVDDIGLAVVTKGFKLGA